MKKIFLNNVVVRDNNLSDYEMAIYIALRSLYDTQRDLQYITYNSIVFELYSHLQMQIPHEWRSHSASSGVIIPQ